MHACENVPYHWDTGRKKKKKWLSRWDSVASPRFVDTLFGRGGGGDEELAAGGASHQSGGGVFLFCASVVSGCVASVFVSVLAR